MNGATCTQIANEYGCTCRPGWSGSVCDVQMLPCKSIAKQKGADPRHVCLHGGTCHDDGFMHRCHCRPGFTGTYCEIEIDNCASSPCRNGATCNNFSGHYFCRCVPGYEGRNCEHNTNECSSLPCQHGATCHDLVNAFRCTCRAGTTGTHCETNVNDCNPSACQNGGTCVDRINGFRCLCRPGFVGSRCENDLNECLSSPCSRPGALACVQLVNGFKCICQGGWTGRFCEAKTMSCAQQSPCFNNGRCTETPSGPNCICPKGFTGNFCDELAGSCQSSPCLNGGICTQRNPDGYVCDCPSGTSGHICLPSKVSACHSQPCSNGGTCIVTADDGYACRCPPFWSGTDCSLHDPRISSLEPDLINVDCHEQTCRELKNNGICDELCNTYNCGYDGHDCNDLPRPYSKCLPANHGRDCYARFNNSRCDEKCNTAECLYDGWDCDAKRNGTNECNPIFDAYCRSNYGNGHCDQGCNTAECGWDGHDCDAQTPEPNRKYADGTLIIIVLVPPDTFVRKAKEFLRQLSLLLHSHVVVKKDDSGKDMIYNWPDEEGRFSLEGARFFDIQHRRKRESTSKVLGSIIHAKLDNSKCVEYCFPSTDDAAEFLYQSMKKSGWTPTIPVKSFGSELDEEEVTGSNYLPVAVAVGFLVVLVAIVLVVVVATARKRAHSQAVWFPEGFKLAGNKPWKSLSTKKANGGISLQPPMTGEQYSSTNSNSGSIISSFSSNDDSLERTRPKRLKSDVSDPLVLNDPRSWKAFQSITQILRSSSMALTPPQSSQVESFSVDVQGPGGITPLMLASLGGDFGAESSLEDGESRDAEVKDGLLSTLLKEGASVNARTDSSGETSLHLAARCGKAEAVKKLLAAGADANARDNSGRTPLHAAVAGDAVSVVKVLLCHPSTKINAQTSDGTTALMSAVRLDIGPLVTELLDSESDVDLADSYGKTALHWAAAVNNLEAAIALLQHGAKRDVQDDRNQTPLFIAAREGSYEVAQLLLENMANSKMPDQMDMLPRDIAAERKHEHVVSLLDNFSAKPLSTVANTQPPDVMLPSYIRQMVKRKREQQESKEVRTAEIPVASSQTRQPAIISSSEAACKSSKKKGQSFAGKQDSVPGNCSKGKGTGSTAVQERKSAKNGSNKQCGNTSKPDAPESHTVLPYRYNVESVSVSKPGELSVPMSVSNQWACRSVDTDRYDVNQNCTSGPASSLLATNAAVWRYEELSPPDSNGPASPNLASNGIHSSPRVKFAGHALAEIRPPDRKKLSGKDQSVSSNRCHQPLSSPPKNVEVVRHCAEPEKPLLSAAGSHLNSNLIGFDVRGQLIDTSSFPFTIQQYSSAPPSLQDSDLPIILQPSSFHALEHCMTPSPDVLAEPWSAGPSSSCSAQSEWIDLSSTQPAGNPAAANRNVAGTGIIKPLCSK